MSAENAAHQTALEAPTVRHVGRDALLYVPGRFIPAAVMLLTIPVLTHFFPPEEIGRYDLTWRLVLFCHTATTMWIGMATLRFYPGCRTGEQQARFFAVYRRILAVGLVVGSALGAIACLFGPDRFFASYRSLLWAGITTYIAYAAYETGLTILRASRKPGLYSIATTISAGLRLPVAMLCFMALNTGIAGMFAALTTTYFLAYLVVVRPYVPRIAWRDVSGARDYFMDIARYGAPIWATQILNFAILNGDRYMFKAFMNGETADRSVGLFAVATNLVDMPMMLVIQTLYFAVFPTVAFTWETHGREDTEKLVSGILRIMLLVGLPMVIFLAVPAHFIFSVLARHESQLAWTVAPWIAVASFLYGMTYIANIGLHLSKHTATLLLITIAGVIAIVTLNVLLLPHYGIAGAGVTRVAANSLLVIVMAAAGWRHIHIHMPWASAIRIALAAAGMGAALYGVTVLFSPTIFSLLILCATAALSYAACLYLFREITVRETKEFLRFVLSRSA